MATAEEESSALRLFVAMPGTNMGADAKWKNPDDVKFFFRKVRNELAERIGRKVDLIIEKEKRSGGVIHDSMFREAYEAEIYVADLTGNNPNVFLELGVRYALRRGVTVIVSQDSKAIPFNVESMRAVQYANRPDEKAIEDIVEFIVTGLGSKDHCDSPVMSALDLIAIPRKQWEEVAHTRVEALLAAAELQMNRDHCFSLLRQAVEADPLSVKARSRFAQELRLAGRYTEALDVLSKGIALDPSQPGLFHERGLCFGRLGMLEKAVEAHRSAVRLDPDDTNTRSSLGGALRRLALANAPHEYDRHTLEESLGQYFVAYDVNHHDTYAGLNVAKSKLFLSKWDPQMSAEAEELFKKLYHLCAFESADCPDNYWRLFDLADTLVFQGQAESALATYTAAVVKVPKEERGDVLRSPQSSLSELAEANVLTEEVKSGVAAIIDLLGAEIISSSRAQSAGADDVQ